MMHYLKWIAKHDEIDSAVLELSRMLWYSKQLRTAGRQKNKVYRLKSARGLFTIRKDSGHDFNINRVLVTPVVRDFMLHPVYNYNTRGMWNIAKRGTTIPRSTATPVRTFYILYNYARKP